MKSKVFLRPATAAAAVAVAVLTAMLPAQAQPDLKADEAAIRQARTLQTQALAAGDLDKVVSYWSPDITIRRALGQPVADAAAARKLLEPTGSAATPIIYQREAVAVEVSPHWPMAYEEGRWSGHPGGVTSPAIIGGRYSAQWVKRDGRWLIRSEVFVALTCADNGCKFPSAP